MKQRTSTALAKHGVEWAEVQAIDWDEQGFEPDARLRIHS